MPIGKGGREPKAPNTAKLKARLVANLLGTPKATARSRVHGKTSASLDMDQLLALGGSHRVLVVDVDPQPSAAMADIQQALDETRQSYDPIILDCPPGRLSSP
ncbi:ParA family protein [Streptomyces zaomyceticus]|uniref:ParA family protein n=1 Tax=Streptomyces zaomyceticus TaxID=68286 RepID=UPI0037883BF8